MIFHFHASRIWQGIRISRFFTSIISRKFQLYIDIKRIDKADDLLEAGATEVTLAVNGPGYDLAPVKEWISWRDSKG